MSPLPTSLQVSPSASRVSLRLSPCRPASTPPACVSVSSLVPYGIRQACSVDELPGMAEQSGKRQRRSNASTISLSNAARSLGSGRGEARSTASSTERSNATLPLLVWISTCTTSPFAICTTRISHSSPAAVPGGRTQLRSIFPLIRAMYSARPGWRSASRSRRYARRRSASRRLCAKARRSCALRCSALRRSAVTFAHRTSTR